LIVIIGIGAAFYIVKKKKAQASDPMKKEKDLEK
jgi:hypothetical protein